MTVPDTTWQDGAACVGVETALFFPERAADPRPAQAVCATCPVAQQCLEYALTVGEDFGIWGGKTARDRRSILQARSGAHQTGLVGALALRGLKQRELAERLGVNRSSVSLWARGINTPTTERQAAIEEVLGPIDWEAQVAA